MKYKFLPFLICSFLLLVICGNMETLPLNAQQAKTRKLSGTVVNNVSEKIESSQPKILNNISPSISSHKNNPIRMQKAGGLEESFDGDVFPPDGWTSNITIGDSGWRVTATTPFSGIQAAYSRYQPTDTNITVGSKWLITKQVALIGQDEPLTFWVRRFYTSIWPPDTLYVRLSFTGQDPADFTTEVYKCYTGDTTNVDPNIYSTVYKQFTAPMGTVAGAAYIAFVHEDNNGQSLFLDDVILGPSGVHEFLTGIPGTYMLNQNYPNPFNPSTKISFGVPEQSHVLIRIFNVLGQEVSTLVNGIVNAGYYRADWDGSNIPGGVYFYRMDATATNSTQKFTRINKMIMLK